MRQKRDRRKEKWKRKEARAEDEKILLSEDSSLSVYSSGGSRSYRMGCLRSYADPFLFSFLATASAAAAFPTAVE